MPQKIKVIVIDDSLLFLEFISSALATEPFIELVGRFSSPFEAQQKVAALSPDVIVLDMELPGIRGVDLMPKLRAACPNTPVVVISSISNNVFEALRAGAIDFVSKPNPQYKVDNATFARELIRKIKIAAASNAARVTIPAPKAKPATGSPLFSRPVTRNPKTVIAIGASTGGTEATLAIVREFPANMPGVLVVQHMPEVFTNMYAQRLDRLCEMEVREAVNGDRLTAGLILVAPGNQHMQLRQDAGGYYVHCAVGDKVSGHCPSVDVMFQSVAKTAGANAIGIILTGMGSDGAQGMLAMKQAGAHTIGQDQSSCVVYGMPFAAYKIGAVSEQVSLNNIAESVMRKLAKPGG